jgi:diguanylate cyclase (GGDEF)-like protein
MLELISHVVNISARRDRTEINSAMTSALRDLFDPQQSTIYRCYPNSPEDVLLFACAGYTPAGEFVRNAYLPDRRYCHSLARDPLLHDSYRSHQASIERLADGRRRIVLPIHSSQSLAPDYLIDLLLPASLSTGEESTLKGLVDYFSNHIALLDYGETDTLTRLSSRKTFEKHLFEMLGQSLPDPEGDAPAVPHRRHGARDDCPHWLAVCDIDHFKRINDTHGHLIGDEVLIMLANTMRQTFRIEDQLFRFGGEEFIALLQPTSAPDAMATLERFRRKVAEQIYSRVGHVTISIGFSQLQPNDTPNDVIDRADEALYYAKQNGRNRVECYERLVASGALAARTDLTGEIELF